MENIITQLPVLMTVFCIAGIGGGMLSGVFGVGGGILFVPALFYIFHLVGLSEFSAIHMAVGTSLAVSIPTTLTSYLAHKKNKRVDEPLLRSVFIFIVFGVAFGAYLASQIEGKIILRIFSVFLILASLFIVMTSEAKPIFKKVPPNPVRGFFAFLIGSFSSLIGIGGGTITVPKLIICGEPIKKAIGTASAASFIVCFFGALSHMVAGATSAPTAPYSLGYVNMLAFAVMTPFGFLGAVLGTKITEKIHAERLRWLFSFFLALLGLKMVIDAF